MQSLVVRSALACVSTYLPTKCGIASFTHSLIGGLRDSGVAADVVAIDQGENDPFHPDVAFSFRPEEPVSVAAAAAHLERYQAVIIQHEFGIYGPHDGSAVLDLAAAIKAPLIVTLHTVLPAPTPLQRTIIESLADRADMVVVMTRAARRMLLARYLVDPHKVAVIPHGTRLSVSRHARSSRQLLTWGLIGPGKGLEQSIGAMSDLRDLAPRYRIVGETHPKVIAFEGEAYRRRLEKLVVQDGLDHVVSFENHYVDDRLLTRHLSEAAVVVLPYETTTQVTSGVLVEAVSAGVPVVATAFPHSIELGRQDAVAVVPHNDPLAIAREVRRLLTDDVARDRMVAAQMALAPGFRWPAIADSYLQLMPARAGAVA
jgi:polysaccharide biosynthesis protein PslF